MVFLDLLKTNVIRKEVSDDTYVNVPQKQVMKMFI